MKSALILCFVLVMSSGMAQSYLDIGSLSYTTSSSNSFEDSSAKTSIEELSGWIDYPIVLSERSTLLTGIYASQLKLRLFPNAEQSNLQSMGIKLGLHYSFSEEQSISMILRPKLAGATGHLDKDALQLGVVALYTDTHSKGWKYRTGLYLNTECYGLLVVPLFGVYYQNDNRSFELDATLPVQADMNYTLSNKMVLGLNFDGLGITYNHELPDDNREVYVSKISNELFAYFRIPLGKSLFLRSKIGYSFFRKFEVYDKDDKVDFNLITFFINDNRTRLNPLTNDGFLYKFELVYRFHFTDNSNAIQ